MTDGIGLTDNDLLSLSSSYSSSCTKFCSSCTFSSLSWFSFLLLPLFVFMCLLFVLVLQRWWRQCWWLRREENVQSKREKKNGIFAINYVRVNLKSHNNMWNNYHKKNGKFNMVKDLALFCLDIALFSSYNNDQKLCVLGHGLNDLFNGLNSKKKN